MQFSEMESLTWLDNHMIEKFLKPNENDSAIKVIDTQVQPATKKCENYTSEIFRARVKYSSIRDGIETTKTKSIIIKVAVSQVAYLENLVRTFRFPQQHFTYSPRESKYS